MGLAKTGLNREVVLIPSGLNRDILLYFINKIGSSEIVSEEKRSLVGDGISEKFCPYGGTMTNLILFCSR